MTRQLRPTNFYNGLRPDDRDRVAVVYAGVADPARCELYDAEYRKIRKEDGVIRWVAAKSHGVFDKTGRCIRVIGTAIVGASRLSHAIVRSGTPFVDKLRAVVGSASALPRTRSPFPTTRKSQVKALYSTDCEPATKWDPSADPLHATDIAVEKSFGTGVPFGANQDPATLSICAVVSRCWPSSGWGPTSGPIHIHLRQHDAERMAA